MPAPRRRRGSGQLAVLGGLAALLLAAGTGCRTGVSQPQALSGAALSAAASTVPGDVVDVLTGQVTAATGSGTVTPVLIFEGNGGSVLASVPGQAVATAAGTWSSLVPTVAVAPAGTTGVTTSFSASSGLSGVATRDVAVASHTVSTPPVDGPLSVVGNRIVDAAGHDVILRGVDLTQLLGAATAGDVTEQELEGIRAWGANLVRVSVGEQLLLPGACQYEASYATDLQQVVQQITRLGMVALIDLHESEPVGCLGAGNQDMADNPGSVTFWQDVATMFAGNPLVAFDLYNEPHDISNAVWLDGGTATDWLPYRAAGMQQLYDAVRSTGATNLVVVSGNNWANDVPPTLLTGSDIVYSVHAYTCPTVAPPACHTPNPYDPAPILEPWVALGKQVPVLIGEFGWPSGTNGTYNQAVVDFARTQGWGWNAYSWNRGTFGLLGSAAGSVSEPDPAGMPLLASLAGGSATGGTPAPATSSGPGQTGSASQPAPGATPGTSQPPGGSSLLTSLLGL